MSSKLDLCIVGAPNTFTYHIRSAYLARLVAQKVLFLEGGSKVLQPKMYVYDDQMTRGQHIEMPCYLLNSEVRREWF